jgi:Fe2+ transport system protein B
LDKALQKNLLEQWRNRLGIPVTLLDSRNPDATELANLRLAILRAQPLLIDSTVGLKLFPEKSSYGKLKTLEKLASFSPISFLLLFFPAWIAVNQANKLADQLYDPLYFLLDPFLHWLNQLPKPLALTLAGDYGVFAMFPFLVLYALPTILMFTALIAIYKSTGLIDRISYGLHTWLVPFGLGGRDLVRVIMGFGCNVPAVVASRSCSSCSRGACVSAISFGSACSYQLPATLAVFSAAGFVWLGSVYLLVLATTTLIYLRITSPRSIKSYKNTIQTQSLIPLQFPNWKTVFGESVQSLRDFIGLALPVFVFICIFAGSLQLLGILNWMSGFLAPVMELFNLPPESALSVVLGSVRKDGLAVGLLDSNWNALKAPLDTPVQVLTAVYLAGVLLPCLVTVFTVVKEMKIHFAIKMVLRQAGFAILFSLSIAWGGSLFYIE